jgi:hypothetical protein
MKLCMHHVNSDYEIVHSNSRTSRIIDTFPCQRLLHDDTAVINFEHRLYVVGTRPRGSGEDGRTDDLA